MFYKLLIAVLLLTTSVYAQRPSLPTTPLDITARIFDKEGFRQISKFSTGEYKGHPRGTDLSKDASCQFTLLKQSAEQAVVAVTILSPAEEGLDLYLHFIKEDATWKVKACRALAMTGMIQRMRDEMKKLTLNQVDSIIEAEKNSDKEYKSFTSRDHYYYELGNADLTLKQDDNIIKHFNDHKAKFEQLKDAALKELQENKEDHAERQIRLIKSRENEYHQLFISNVSYGGYMISEHCLTFLIGGMLDNTVGYLYVQDKKDLPEMSDNRVIMLREIGEGWYLYKTT
ncbi:hypothetical protein [Chitinophaga pinensis]|uniref:Uncharacterized protein n=1 Tax=Chitinophaga pinensis (strain ATCC 43595 / DSM 2588 / LMG 13176 / NBRC 15968 / NCIMB 11800 / UQM 2034) TaxID=485918 RepID=A0A979GRW5_CHIPD|nr:hypothetical protein [Chitinophaga pinensis]ACU60993.1 hypothetical protein Cpin_3529 [Chitinophaga pinensis DSM 2588]